MNHFWSTNAYNFQSFVLADRTMFPVVLAPAAQARGDNAAIPSERTRLNPKDSLQ